MDGWSWLFVALGVALFTWSLVEVWLTIYHKDLDGPASHRLQLAIWKLHVGAGRAWPRARRPLLSFAGPLMVLATFALWVLLFLFGAAFIVWPNLEAYRTEPGTDAAGFVDALYYAGVTGTVLGYGDITPLTPGLKVLTVLISGYGFLLLTGGMAYLVSVVNGASARNVLALRVRAATHRTGDGVRLVIEALRRQELPDVRARLEALASGLRDLQERFHQFSIVDVFYRSLAASHDPEPMLYALADAALAARIVACEEPRLEPEADELLAAITDIMVVIARQHLPRRVQRAIARPHPRAQDREKLENVRKRLRGELGGAYLAGARDEELLELVAQTRIFFAALDRLNGWRSEHLDEP